MTVATTQEQNERLTQVGPGTPMGNLLRRYWHPVAAAIELDKNPVQAVRVLGEDLTLYRDRSGSYGLVARRCPHRGVSLERGIPESHGLRCAYHGWAFDATGQCIEQPFEDRMNPEARYKDRIQITAYPVQELGGLLFAYFGPQPAPLLPRWDILVQDDLDRAIEVVPLPCNWLQCMDNSVDPVHFEFLHARFGDYERAKMGLPPRMAPARHLKIAFDEYRFGIMKRRLLEGAGEDSDDWTTGHPLIFPNLLAVGPIGEASFQYRVPVDDVNTIHLGYRTMARKSGAEAKPLTVTYVRLFDDNCPIQGDTIPKQDFIAWTSQGPISDRTQEHLTATDAGVILYHKMLSENMKRVERGEDPMAIVRDRAENEPMIRVPREHARLQEFAVTDDDYFEKTRQLAHIRS
jgi:5,5'-dehydrodivanillate O-demethylase